MKKALSLGVMVGLMLLICGTAWTQEAGDYQILIVANQNYPFYRQAVHGFLLGLREQGYHEDNVTFEYLKMDAGSGAGLERLQSTMSRRPPDLVYVVGAAAADIVVKEIQSVPVVFSGIYRPAGKLVQEESADEVNACGVTVSVPMEKVAAFFKIAYSFEKMVVVVSPGDLDGEKQLEDIRSVGETLDFEVEAIKLGPDNLESPLEDIQRDEKVVLFIPLDLGVYDSLRSLLADAVEKKIPVFSVSYEVVLRGGHLGFTANFYLAGEMAAFKAVPLLTGESSPAELSSHTIPMYDIVVNERSAREIELQFPPEVYSAGVQIIK